MLKTSKTQEDELGEIGDLYNLKREHELSQETLAVFIQVKLKLLIINFLIKLNFQALNSAMSKKADEMFKANEISEAIGKCLLAIEDLPIKFGKVEAKLTLRLRAVICNLDANLDVS